MWLGDMSLRNTGWWQLPTELDVLRDMWEGSGEVRWHGRHHNIVSN